MKRKSFQQLPSTNICVAVSKRVLVIQRKYTIGHRCKTVPHVPAKSNTNSMTLKATKGPYFIYTLSCGVATYSISVKKQEKL